MSTPYSVSQSLAEVAADRLWRFQLRKENKAILAQLENNDKQKHILTEENKRLFESCDEKILKLEAKISQLEQELSDKTQAWEKFRSEQRAQTAELKIQIKLFLQSRGIYAEDEIRALMADKVLVTANCNSSLATNQIPNAKIKSIPTRHLQPSLYHISDYELVTAQNIERSIRSKAKEINFPKHTNSRFERDPFEHTPFSSRPIETTIASKLPKLKQGRGQLRQYFEKANLVHSSIAYLTEQSEIELVNLFINGITKLKARERLVGQLQQIHPSKQKKDGRVEIICGWAELGVAVKNFISRAENKGVDRKQWITSSISATETSNI